MSLKKLTMCLSLCLCLLAVSCFSKFNADNLSLVSHGMTEAEVKKLIGSPDKINTGSALGFSGTTYRYEKKNGSAEITFINGKVVAKNIKM
ncbi:MAG: hypothetical protein AAF984_07605 [Verrucomicrobiota bacterium]